MRLRNYWNISYGGDRNFEFLDDLDTPRRAADRQAGERTSTTSTSAATRASDGGSACPTQATTTARAGCRTIRTRTCGCSPRAGSRRTSASTPHARRDSAQWIENTDADGDGTEDNVYGRLKRNVVNITGRATYAFSRDMTLEAFLQPFVAVGDYYDIRKLARAKSFDFHPGVARRQSRLQPQIPARQHRLAVGIHARQHAVRRLEHGDSGRTRAGLFSARRDLGTAFGAPGDHVFVVKLNYWLSL